MKKKKGIYIICLLLFSVMSLLLTLIIGPVFIPFFDSLRSLMSPLLGQEGLSPTESIIINQIRFPRVIIGYSVGWSLGLAGAVMQGLFLNPLASPYVLGIASGASAGAAASIVLKLNRTFGPFSLPLGAFIGGIFAVAVVFHLSQQGNSRASTYKMILTGVAMGAFFSALTSLFIFAASAEGVREIVFWTMGGLDRSQWSYVYILLPVVALSSLAIFALARDLNVMALGEEKAGFLGIDTEKVKKILLLSATLLTTTSISFTGTIGFVGLITPHAVRLVTGPDNRILLPVTAFVGGLFLLWTDAGARTMLQPVEIPVGIITSFFGAPFFIWLLVKRKGGEIG